MALLVLVIFLKIKCVQKLKQCTNLILQGENYTSFAVSLLNCSQNARGEGQGVLISIEGGGLIQGFPVSIKFLRSSVQGSDQVTTEEEYYFNLWSN